MIVTRVTKGISVSVESRFEEKHSNPAGKYFLFSYHITIENNSDQAYQLRRRHWHIVDSNGEYREVEGPGVVGEQPVIFPGQHYHYSSSCNFATEIGKMYGTYLMERVSDRQVEEIDIPEFLMIVPARLN